MTDAAWGTLSNQAVAAAAVVYFLALLAYVVEWASLRQVDRSARPGRRRRPGGRAGARRPTSSGTATGSRCSAGSGSCSPASPWPSTSSPWSRRGMSADPNRVPWGNMYEFTLAGTFVVAALYLVLSRRYALDWLGPVVVTFVLALLMVAVVWLYDPTGPLPEALNSYWLVIHVVSAITATGAFTLGGMTSAAYLLKRRRGADAPRPACGPGCPRWRSST